MNGGAYALGETTIVYTMVQTALTISEIINIAQQGQGHTDDHLLLCRAKSVAEARNLRPKALPVHDVRDQLLRQRRPLRPEYPRRLQLTCALKMDEWTQLPRRICAIDEPGLCAHYLGCYPKLGLCQS